ncbi:MAG: MATE family efflux transporter [Lachnospiraceae bacterium]|nr:MATE family efflux transporter [Lachnospiraceae bacterium]
MKKESMFRDREFMEKLWKLTIPITLQSLMLALVAAADAFMLGAVEQNQMSAVSLAAQIQFVQNMMLSAVTSAFMVLGAQYWGKKDTDTVEDVFCIGLRVNAFISFLFFLGCQLCPGFLMTIFTNETVLVDIGVEYLRIAGWSYLFTGISQCYLSLMKVSEHPAQASLISSVTVVLNVVLNAILIFGLLGFPAMGVRGAALATLIARAIELLWSFLYSLRPGYIRVRLSALVRFRKLLEKDFYKCMLPLMGACLVWSVGFTSYTAFMGHLGTDAAAANSVTSVVRDLVCCVSVGVASAAGIMVGNELGAGHLEKGKLYGDRFTQLSFLIGFASTLVMLLATPVLLWCVKLTEGARGLLTGMMVVMAFYMIGRCVNSVIINGVFAAGGDTMFDLYSLAVTMWMIAVPLAALGTFVFHWNPILVYACTCLDEIGKIPWVLIHFKKYRWVKDLTR